MTGHAVGPEGDDEVGLDVGDVPGDCRGAVAAITAAVGVAEQAELVDAEHGEAVAELDVPERRELAPAARSSGRSCRARRAWR